MAGLPKFDKSVISSDLKKQVTIFKRKFNGEKKMNAEKKKNGSFQKKRESQVRFSFQTRRGVFNIFITLIDYCGGYPRARGRGACSWFGVPDEYPGAMTAEVIPGRRIGGIFPLRASEGIDIFFFQHSGILLIFAT